jgi:hypothetical protein
MKAIRMCALAGLFLAAGCKDDRPTWTPSETTEHYRWLREREAERKAREAERAEEKGYGR